MWLRWELTNDSVFIAEFIFSFFGMFMVETISNNSEGPDFFPGLSHNTSISTL